jgi:hypothetical protein
MTSPIFFHTFIEIVYMTAIGCEIGLGSTTELHAADAAACRPATSGAAAYCNAPVTSRQARSHVFIDQRQHRQCPAIACHRVHQVLATWSWSNLSVSASEFLALIRHLTQARLQKSSKARSIYDAGWSSLVARRAHNPKVVSSNLTPATNFGFTGRAQAPGLFFFAN